MSDLEARKQAVMKSIKQRLFSYDIPNLHDRSVYIFEDEPERFIQDVSTLGKKVIQLSFMQESEREIIQSFLSNPTFESAQSVLELMYNNFLLGK